MTGLNTKHLTLLVSALALASAPAFGQDPTASLGGYAADPAGEPLSAATVTLSHLASGAVHTQAVRQDGSFLFILLPIGEYELRVEATQFAPFIRRPVALRINDRARVTATLDLATARESIEVRAQEVQAETDSNVLGKVVTAREILDLPLNGRNFTQLGLLQPGVAPLTGGLTTAGGSLRSGQAFSVNGQRPEANNYLLDGARNVNRMDAGFAIRVPVDAIAEFRILTHTAPPEFGGNSGSTTSVVTRSGANDIHGSVYYFGRNDVFDARNFFSVDVEPLKQHQYGATLGAPLIRNRLFFFGYWEGFRNRQGVTKAATVPTAGQRIGDFSGRRDPQTGDQIPLINFATGQPFADNRIPASMIHPIAREILEYYPTGNLGPSLFSATQVMRNTYDQGGSRVDFNQRETDQWMLRYAVSNVSNVNPLSVRGADVPGFPVGDEIVTHSGVLGHTHVFSPTTINAARVAFFRHDFLFDKRLSHRPPRALGFNYDTTYPAAEGVPYHIVQGYASVGNPITGPRDTVQSTFEMFEAMSMVRGAHSAKFGGEFRRTQINVSQGIASNGFFVFGSFPASDPFANLLLGRPVVFFQGGGDLARGLRSFDFAGYAQDEWRATRRLTVNFGVRYEISSPFAEVRDRLNAFIPGQQSTVFPDAPPGVLFPGDAGVPKHILPMYYGGVMPRVGLAYDPSGNGRTSIRAAYGVFYDQFSNGAGQPMQVPISAVPWTQAVQISGPTLNYADPLGGQPPSSGTAFPRPSTVVTLDHAAKMPYSQNWNLSIQRALGEAYLIEARYVGTKGTRVPRYVEANPAIFGAGATAQNADARRQYASCTTPGEPCRLGHVAMITYGTNSTYHAAQSSLTRRFRGGLGFQGSYWFSKTLDYVSSISVAGSAPRLVSGENDLAQNPFDLNAERGPSLFDARHRFTSSLTWRIPNPRNTPVGPLLRNWQINGIATRSSGTPFTIYDTANVSLQGSTPPITGFFSSRPDMIGDPNAGPRRPEQWLTREPFRRLNPATEAGQFGSAGRNIARGPGVANLDLSLFRTFALAEGKQLQFRAECFNVTNTANFGVPVNDLASPNFGRVLESAPPRLFQLAVKILF